jgi:hypothetical protein
LGWTVFNEALGHLPASRNTNAPSKQQYRTL